jgi:inner membrane protein
MDSFTQIALGIAIAEVCAGKKLKNKTILYGSILGTIPDLDVVVGLFFRSCKCSPPGHKSFALSVFLFLSLLGWIISKLEKNRIDFLQASYMVLAVCLPMYYWICLPLGDTNFMAFRL